MTTNIDMTFYINLSHRIDRKQLIETELNNYNLPFERFEAHNIPNFGELGCSKSHLDILKIARDRNYENILIFEDDFQFIVSKTEFEEELDKLFKSNIIFGGCLLSYNLFKYEKTRFDFLWRVINVQTTSGYIVNKRCYNRFIELIEKNIKMLEITKNKSKYTIDQCWKTLHKYGYWYCFSKRIGKQRIGYSDIEKQIIDYNC
jgi:glycosyl transferase family 25